MNKKIIIAALVLGVISIILGAFGAHALKKILSVERLESFETGVRYQMYAAFFLLIAGYILKFDTSSQKWISILMIAGTMLFSFSIYFLSMQDYLGMNLKFLGPITPLGGLCMIISWGLLIFYFAKTKI